MNLVTGGSGFVGGRLIRLLKREGREVRSFSRHPLPSQIECVQGDLLDLESLRMACAGVQTVFHCAGYAHAFKAVSASDAARHWQVNFQGTRRLLEAAGEAGVSGFVFLSSVKAMADPGQACVNELWPGEPDSDYGRAKRAAEMEVIDAGRRFGMRVTNLRLSMVYGAGGRGNLERMARLIQRGWFPPLPETGNHRSLVHVDDVVAAIQLVASNSRANGKTYIVAGPDAPSGRQLFEALRLALGMRACGWAVPEGLLRIAAYCGDQLEVLSGRYSPLNTEIIDRLLGSAWYSPELINRELGWRAQIGLELGLRELVGR
jgi:nucleoside-diphosphate-sugar epimerase